MSYEYVKFHLDVVENEITSFDILFDGSKISMQISHYSD